MDYSYIVLILPALIFSLIAQAMVRSAFRKYSEMSAGMTGEQAAKMVMQMNDVPAVPVVPIAGTLTDNYDPKAQTLRLPQGVFAAGSVSAVGVAAHEAGHAVQYAKGYFPIQVRNAIIPVSQIGAKISWPLLMIGIVLGSQHLFLIGILLFSAAVLFQLVTLPVEFNASRRAMAAIRESSYFTDEQIRGAKKVLTAAALTYVAALAMSVAQLLRLLLMFSGNSRRRR